MEVPLFKTNKHSKSANWWLLFQGYGMQKEFALTLNEMHGIFDNRRAKKT